jgi:hypothetical protein
VQAPHQQVKLLKQELYEESSKASQDVYKTWFKDVIRIPNLTLHQLAEATTQTLSNEKKSRPIPML